MIQINIFGDGFMYSIRLLEEGVGSGLVEGYVWVGLAIFILVVFIGWLASSRGWLKQEIPVQNNHKVDNQAHH